MNFSRSGSNLFQRASPVFNHLFQRGSNLAMQSSAGLGNIGRILDKASTIGGQIASSPALASIKHPEVQRGLSLIQQASNVARKGSSLAHAGEHFLHEGTYKGGHEANITNALERAKGIRKDASNMFR